MGLARSWRRPLTESLYCPKVQHRGWAAIVFVWTAALVLSACGGGSDESSGASESATSEDAPTTTAVPESSGTANAGSLIVDGAVDVVALEALADEFEVLDEEQQFDRLNELSGQLERDLFNLSGLEEGLGGTEVVDASIIETGQWLAALAVEVEFRRIGRARSTGVPQRSSSTNRRSTEPRRGPIRRDDGHRARW